MMRYDSANAHIVVYKSTGWAIFIWLYYLTEILILI
jgi:hypothetical protein